VGFEHAGLRVPIVHDDERGYASLLDAGEARGENDY
jgi:hypothetical protein